MKAEDSTESSTGEASRFLVSAGGSGALAFGFLLYERLIVFGTMNTTAFNSEKYKF